MWATIEVEIPTKGRTRLKPESSESRSPKRSLRDSNPNTRERERENKINKYEELTILLSFGFWFVSFTEASGSAVSSLS